MDPITALAVSIGLLGGVATLLFLNVGTIQIWIAFIGWGSYFHCGGGAGGGFQKSVVAGIWGAIMGFIALLVITQVSIALPIALWPSIVVAVTVFIMVLGAKVEALGAIPAAVYGYAATAGYGLLSGASVTEMSLANPLVCSVISLVVGAVFGIISEKVAGALGKSKASETSKA
jgi:Protein of unknown function (DUF1097)